MPTVGSTTNPGYWVFRVCNCNDLKSWKPATWSQWVSLESRVSQESNQPALALRYYTSIFDGIIYWNINSGDWSKVPRHEHAKKIAAVLVPWEKKKPESLGRWVADHQRKYSLWRHWLIVNSKTTNFAYDF